ncbi:MaoC/PaaZ C-terminal domain-containing protein [Nocardioides donggukensis]|uniref:MaoC family dehydratase N-terminal domain-containing protein n=1 Tax=Nocardioides donggukensis TaxID=2774019 RepID=A0A927Q2E5_9ACTN|nr:MaoC/PaaZ C-terminal domain-containing protein [Nocardioides donggukensis]MBD8869596.1 MaoC family dehydratase N-terminal domain-containing protein [Nocardioides donggukensis]
MTTVRTLDPQAGAGLGTMLRAALPTVPVVNRLPGVRKSTKDLPDLTVRRERVAVERSQVDDYAAVCGFPTRDVVPLTYLHMLAFPLHMAIMTDTSFPFPAIGTVHLENAITRHRPVRVGERVSLSARAEHLRTHAKGRAFDLAVTADVDGETVWESTSTYLRLGGGDREHGERGTVFAEVASGGPTWRLPGDLGRRYAAVSGDHNPIHLYPLTAKAFGFPRHIAHGMWTKARAVAALENRLPDAVVVEVGFKKPVFLPGTVGFGATRTADGYDFAVNHPTSGAPHLLGRTTAR